MYKILVLHHTFFDKKKYELSFRIWRYFETDFIVNSTIFLKREIGLSFDPSFFEDKTILLPFNSDYYIKKILNFCYIMYRNLLFIKQSCPDLIFLKYSHSIMDLFLILYPLIFFKKKFFLQMSTPSVSSSAIIRFVSDSIGKFVMFFFPNIGDSGTRNISIFKIPEQKIVRAEIGFPDYGLKLKKFDEINLIYIGTLSNRELWKSVKGVSIYKNKYPQVKIKYEIVGSGDSTSIKLLNNEILINKIEDSITYHGFLYRNEISKILEKCNIGVSFVPIVDYYQDVPVTKTIEYMLAGLPVLGTKVSFNIQHINNETGVLCDDTPEDFANAIENISSRLLEFNSNTIRNFVEKYSMNSVIKEKYLPHLKELIKGKAI